MEKDYILEINNIDKVFHIRKVLDDLSLKIERATVHGLVGENGAGKSTLINIIAGLVKADSGTIFFDNEKCEFKTPNDTRIKGISVIHQEIKLAEPLTVWENIFLGNFKIKNHLVDVKGMQTEARKMIQDLGMDIDVLSQVSTLPVAKNKLWKYFTH